MSKVIGRSVLLFLPVTAIVIGFIALFAALFITAPQPERSEFTPRPVAVFVEEAQPEPVRLSVNTQGEVRPMIEIDLTAQVAGLIDYVNPAFVEGGFFEAGETLVRLEDADYRLAVTRAEALVAQRRQQLIREEAEAELAREEWEAIGDGEASPLTLREPQLADARAQLAGAQASLEEARLNLSRTRISAPFSGRVRSKQADLGQYVGPGARIGRVFSTDQVQIRLPLTDAELGVLGIPLAFEAGEAAPAPRVELSAVVAGEQRSWEGRVLRTDSAIDPQTRVLYALVEVEDPYGAAAEAAGAPLAVGLFVDAAIEGRTLQEAYELPRSALRGADSVFVATREGRLEIREATVADTGPDSVILTAGLEPGDLVVTSPLRAPAEGMLLSVFDQDGEPVEGVARHDETGGDGDAEDETPGAETAEAAAVAQAG